MNAQTVYAVYEDGAFRILSPEPVGLAEGQHVRLQVERRPSAQEILDAAAAVYAGMSEEEIAEFERTFFRRGDMFRDPSES